MIQKRTNYVKTKEVDGKKEKDFLLNSFSKFVWARPMTSYRLTYDDFMRPDLISMKVYGTVEYWWIILKANPGFDDIYNDFGVELTGTQDYQIDTLINCPHPLDIKEYITFSNSFMEQG